MGNTTNRYGDSTNGDRMICEILHGDINTMASGWIMAILAKCERCRLR